MWAYIVNILCLVKIICTKKLEKGQNLIKETFVTSNIDLIEERFHHINSKNERQKCLLLINQVTLKDKIS